MSDWMYENRSILYLLLGVALIVLAGIWWYTRKRSYVIAGGALLAVLALFFVFDHFLRGESDRERIEHQVQELAASLKAPDLEHKLAALVSNDFLSPAGARKDAFCKRAAEFTRQHQVKEVRVSDFDFEEVSRATRTARVRFHVHATGSDFDAPATCLLTLRLDPDKQWRLQTYKVYWPPNTTNEFPGVP